MGEEGVLGLMEATMACRKMNVTTSVSDRLSLQSVLMGSRSEAMPVNATSSVGTIRL